MPTPNIANGSQGTLLLLMQTSRYESWLAQQDAFVSQQLATTGFTGKGHCVLIDKTGAADFVLVCLEDIDAYFLAGDLPRELPVGEYRLAARSVEDFAEDQRATLIQKFIESWGHAAYQYDAYKEAKPASTLFVDDANMIDMAGRAISAVKLTRDLVNTPAGDMMPEHLSEAARSLADLHGAQFSEIIGDQLLAENYPTIHAVGRASDHVPRLLDLRWGDANAPKVTLVGKGVCFDSGGLNMKPGNFMRLMKKDMGGAAHVLGLASLIMANKLPVCLRVLIPAVENAVSGNAFRPGDVITTRKGITVEIDNTDAEGRLVLCDALDEANSEDPELIIDFATLTGACRVALGTELPGMFCNDDEVAHSLFKHGLEQADPVWQLPLHKAYQDMLKSEVADTVNSASSPYAGAITAALYLQLFVKQDTPWVHFDVMAWNVRKLPGRPIGGEAFGIRAVFAYLQSRFG